ncbi:hypothetical protein M6B38_346960 [Iris pallida]|uniref:Uncharacterized protein n=1 Tax=Iris pallida TaxID=29817 RepID=A0AAX6GT17_IRIPA|nr:hypothetical protein M6B38_346960 [Iris pallida]
MLLMLNCQNPNIPGFLLFQFKLVIKKKNCYLLCLPHCTCMLYMRFQFKKKKKKTLVEFCV